jgi:membrane-bound lytic murein transglycosylase B
MRSIIRFSHLIICLLWLALVEAATCRDPAGFEAWLARFKREAAAQGISPSAISALNGVTYDLSIISKDHSQGVFHQSFEQFAGRMVNSSRLHMTFARIEQTYDVPVPVIVAIWGSRRISALSTAICRLCGRWRLSLMIAAAPISSRPRFSTPCASSSAATCPPARCAAWAGELGQTQFMPSSYLKFAVGRRDLIHSAPDALASTANYLRAYGWQRGGAWPPGSANFAVIDVYSRTIAYFAS